MVARLLSNALPREARRRIWQRLSPERRLDALRAGYDDIWDAWADHDVDRLVQGYEPEIVVDYSGFENWVGAPTYFGFDGARRAIVDWMDAWPEARLGTGSLTLAGDRALVHVLISGKAASDGHTDYWQVVDLTGTGVSRFAQYTRQADALADIGLTREEFDASFEGQG
jgi:hypothetical protein